MKIIQLIQKPQLRGAEIFACQLSNHLMEKGHSVLVVSIFNGDAQLPFKEKLIALDRPLSKRFFDFKGWKKFNSIIREFKPDIIQANAADTLKFAVGSKTIHSWQTPIVFRNANKMGDFIDSELKFYLNKWYLSKVSQVISVSKECQKDFEKTFKWPSNNITTVEIGVEEKTYGEIPSDLDFIYKKGRVLCHIGGFAPEKNHLGLLNIFGKVKAQFPDLQLLLIGKGRLEDEVREEVKNLKLNDSVHFLGYRNDVLEILSSSQIFVLPSLIEGLPAVILEAMYCETPVVAYNVGGIREVVISGETGWLVTKNDREGFVESLLEILTNQSRIKKRVSQAKLMVSKNFMNTVIAEKFLDCYKYVSKQT